MKENLYINGILKANQLKNRVDREGGVTLYVSYDTLYSLDNFVTVSAVKGYQVCPSSSVERVTDADGFEKVAHDILRDIGFRLAVETVENYVETKEMTNGFAFFGVWKNGDSYIFDTVSEWYETEAEARKIGMEANQTAIYSWLTGECITL